MKVVEELLLEPIELSTLYYFVRYRAIESPVWIV